MATIQTASNRIHVLQVVGNAIVGGMETYVTRLIERLPRDRFGATVLCPFEGRFSDQLRALGHEVLITPMPQENPTWGSIQLAASLVKAHAIDVLHAHLPNAHMLAALAGKLAGKPVVTTIHGRQLTATDLEVHRMAGTHLSVVCKHSYYHALGMGVDPARVHCIPNGVDVETFQPRRVRNGPLRERFGIAPDAPLVGFVGRLSPEKGPDIFMRAALALKTQFRQARFILVGDGPMALEMRSFIERYAMGDAVHLAGLQSDMPGVFSELDIVVSTSHSEAMPLALMEAMACGVPVVATRVGGVPDLVQHGLTGWLAGPADYEGVAARTAELLRSQQEREAMGARSRALAVERFSLDDSVAATTLLLSRLAQQRSTSSGEASTRRVSAVGGAVGSAMQSPERGGRGATG